MQDIYAPCQADGVDGAIRVASMVFDDLQDTCAAEAAQRFGIAVLSATLRYVECLANRVLHVFCNVSVVCSGAPDPNDRLGAGQCRHFHIMPKRA